MVGEGSPEERSETTKKEGFVKQVGFKRRSERVRKLWMSRVVNKKSSHVVGFR